MKKLNSTLWPEALELIRECHLAHAGIEEKSVEDWNKAFNLLFDAIIDERKTSSAFAAELSFLDATTEITYSFVDILEEYFDYLEDNECWEDVITSCERLIGTFAWNGTHKPSEYKFRIGNALEKLKRYDEAEKFGRDWLAQYPNDLFAGASNVYLLAVMGRLDEAQKLAEHYLGEELICDDGAQTIYMAAYRLFELTNNVNAKNRVSIKMAEYNNLIS